MSEVLTLRDFAPHLHARFRVAQSADYELELAEIADHSNAQLEQFSLTFTGAASPWLKQGLYTLLHPHTREYELFLVPTGPEAGEMHYEAVFSRFVHAPDALIGAS
jgi:hypothetical protein